MTWIDALLLVVLALSALLGLFRGFAREAFSLAGWLLSFWVATHYTDALADLLQEQIAYDELRYVLAFVAIFLATLLVCILFSRLVVGLLRASVLSGSDRLLGILFGLLRGMVLITIVVLLGSMTPLAQEKLWTDSVLVSYLQQLTGWIADRMQLGLTSNWQDALKLGG